MSIYDSYRDIQMDVSSFFRDIDSKFFTLGAVEIEEIIYKSNIKNKLNLGLRLQFIYAKHDEFVSRELVIEMLFYMLKKKGFKSIIIEKPNNRTTDSLIVYIEIEET